ncbi:bifunctional DNA primase/polymerase [Marinicaulis aureus]|uniref:Bifunctional DNA primase/polymerase n=1 Tax=Hyphococcus aureus TaxID=2666033 RepID=A0ABW1KY13_9PROT
MTFAAHYADYFSFGLKVLPVYASKGKGNDEPCINSFYISAPRQNLKMLARLAEQFPGENIGIICGKVSGVTILDIDDAKQAPELEYLAGETPLKVRTSRGIHCYYRHDGETSTDLRRISKYEAEIKSGGTYVMAPPSRRRDKDFEYSFIDGDYSLLPELPTIKPFVADLLLGAKKARGAAMSRNIELFRYLREQARHCDSVDDLIDIALTYAIQLREQYWLKDHPFTDQEAINTARQVWRYKEEGRLFVPGQQTVFIATHDLDRLMAHGAKGRNAITLLLKLRGAHYNRKEFAIAAEAMEEDLKMSAKTIRQARELLVEEGLLRLTRKTKRGSKEPYLYSLVTQ